MRVGTIVRVLPGSYREGCIGTVLRTWELPGGFGWAARVRFPDSTHTDYHLRSLKVATPNLANPLFAMTCDEVP